VLVLTVFALKANAFASADFVPNFSVRHATNTLRLRSSHTNTLQLPLTSAHKHDGTTRSPTVMATLASVVMA
jgi:hypothetical protein